MKKFICLFLMLWLPLFTGAALAMSTQMQVANELQEVQQAPPACHDISQMEDTQHQPAMPAKHCNGHCFACGVCAFGCQAVNFMGISTAFTPDSSSLAPGLIDLVFSSQLYPPALKPPISA